MKKQFRSKEKGQVLVIVSLVMVGLIGFTALVVDGGVTYSQRRYDQNVADASSIAGAGEAAYIMEFNDLTYTDFTCTNGTVLSAMSHAETEALGRASENNFTLDTDISDGHGVLVECMEEDKISHIDKYIQITTQVTSEVEKTFANAVFNSDLQSTVTSISRIRPRTSLAWGNAIASIGSGCGSGNGGVFLSGNIGIQVTGGGVFSNTCIETNGGIDLTVTPSDLGVSYNTTFTQNGGSGTISPAPSQVSETLPLIDIDPPVCGSGSYASQVSVKNKDNTTVNPGKYTSFKQTGGSLTLNPGLYCISGDFNSNGGTLTGNGVTIYMEGGDYYTGGNTEVNLMAPTGLPADVAPAITGMLIFVDPSNTGATVDMRGNAVSSYVGTIYNPEGTISAGGVSSTMPTINTQMIGKDVVVAGNTSVVINFNSSENYQVSASLNLER